MMHGQQNVKFGTHSFSSIGTQTLVTWHSLFFQYWHTHSRDLALIVFPVFAHTHSRDLALTFFPVLAHTLSWLGTHSFSSIGTHTLVTWHSLFPQYWHTHSRDLALTFFPVLAHILSWLGTHCFFSTGTHTLVTWHSLLQRQFPINSVTNTWYYISNICIIYSCKYMSFLNIRIEIKRVPIHCVWKISASLSSCPWFRKLSPYVPCECGILRNIAALLGDKINWTLCIIAIYSRHKSADVMKLPFSHKDKLVLIALCVLKIVACYKD